MVEVVVADPSMTTGDYFPPGDAVSSAYVSVSPWINFNSVSRNRYGLSRLLKRNANSSRYAGRCLTGAA